MRKVKIFPIGAFLLASLVFSSCSSAKKQMDVSSTVPSAQGTVKATSAENGNTEVDLEVNYLAFPEKVRSDASTYVVWLRPNEGSDTQVHNLGALKVDEDLEASLNAVTPYKNFHLFITAENSPQNQEPTGEELLWTNVQSDGRD